MKESVIQRGILDFLFIASTRMDIYWFRAGAGAMRLDSGRFFKTGKPGVPDIVLVMNGKFIGLEVKGPKGRLSPPQRTARDEIVAAGGEYYVVRSISDVKEIIGWN